MKTIILSVGLLALTACRHTASGLGDVPGDHPLRPDPSLRTSDSIYMHKAAVIIEWPGQARQDGTMSLSSK